MSVIDRQISDWSDPRFEIGQMSQKWTIFGTPNMTLRNSICGKGSQKWAKKGPDGRTHGRTDARTDGHDSSVGRRDAYSASRNYVPKVDNLQFNEILTMEFQP